MITGAGGGIGRVTAQVLAGTGVRVVVSDIVAHSIAETVDMIRAQGCEATGVVADVGVEATI